MCLNYVHYHNKRGRSISVVCVFPFSKSPQSCLITVFRFQLFSCLLPLCGGGEGGGSFFENYPKASLAISVIKILQTSIH